MMRIILGITGGIASGKTTVLRMFAKAGIPTLSADDLAHDCIRRGKPAYHAIVRAFGKGILKADREINRKRLGRIVFSDPKARRRLEKIIHPCVFKGLTRFVKGKKGLVALDIPLLFEAGYQDWVDRTIVVFCSPEQQMKRFIRRTGWTPATFREIAGALRYTRYGWLKRRIMRRIVARVGGDTDASRNYEYTDWNDLRAFTVLFDARLRPAPQAHFSELLPTPCVLVGAA